MRHWYLLGIFGVFGCDGEDAAATSDAGADASPLADAAPPTEPPAPTSPSEHALVITELRFSDVISPGVAPGFDLDGVDGACGHPDQVGPDGTPGVDNQLATLMPVFRATEARAIDGLLQESVNGGMVLYVAHLTGLDGWLDDSEVALHLQGAAGPKPYLTTEGLIEPDQTFVFDPESPANLSTGVLEAGTFTSAPFDVGLPVRILDVDFIMQISLGRVQLTLHPDGSADGVFGGAVAVESIVELANGVNTSVRELATNLLRQKADLLPDESGRCTAISVWWQFHAERAFVADW